LAKPALAGGLLPEVKHPVERGRRGTALLDVGLRRGAEGTLPHLPVRALEERLELREGALDASHSTVIEPVIR
jgi:hypothetical protein